MSIIQGLLAILDSRSFSTIWFWVLLMLAWAFHGRTVLGVPVDVIHRAGRKDAAEADQLALLDWLSLTLPRWRVSAAEGIWLIGITAFILTVLLVLGFGYGLEMAQGLFLLLMPFAVLTGIAIRLAQQLSDLLSAARDGAITAHDASVLASRRMRNHRILSALTAIFIVMITTFWGALWLVRRPFGI